jgi:hypothetical protein
MDSNDAMDSVRYAHRQKSYADMESEAATSKLSQTAGAQKDLVFYGSDASIGDQGADIVSIDFVTLGMFIIGKPSMRRFCGKPNLGKPIELNAL